MNIVIRQSTIQEGGAVKAGVRFVMLSAIGLPSVANAVLDATDALYFMSLLLCCSVTVLLICKL